MKRSPIVLASLALVLGFSYLATHRQQIDAEIIPSQEIMVGEVSRSYRLVIPRTLETRAPIVLAFHGTGDTPSSMAEYSKLDALAAKHGFILVYPAAIGGMWATVGAAVDAPEENSDVQFFDRLLVQLTASYNIDTRRIYLVGMSNGASFAQLLASVRAPKIAALVAHSGANATDHKQTDLQRPPIMLIVGKDDMALPFIQAEADDYRSLDRIVQFSSVPGLGHEWSRGSNERIWDFLSQYSLARSGGAASPLFPP